MPTEKILITGKAAPHWSRKKRELTICCGGITENFEHRRLYPIPIKDIDKIHNFSWIEAKVTKQNLPDPRPESRKLLRHLPNYLKVIGRVENHGARKYYLDKCVRPCVEVMKEKRETLGIIKPVIKSMEITEVELKPPEELHDDQTTLAIWANIPSISGQIAYEDWSKAYAVKNFEVRARFTCGEKCQLNEHNMKVLDIEFFMLYQHMYRRYHDKKIAFEKMREKIESENRLKDIYFAMGTHSRYPFVSFMVGSTIRIRKGTKAIPPIASFFT